MLQKGGLVSHGGVVSDSGHEVVLIVGRLVYCVMSGTTLTTVIQQQQQSGITQEKGFALLAKSKGQLFFLISPSSRDSNLELENCPGRVPSMQGVEFRTPGFSSYIIRTQYHAHRRSDYHIRCNGRRFKYKVQAVHTTVPPGISEYWVVTIHGYIGTAALAIG